MADWLTIQCRKEEDPYLKEFIENNPLLDVTMRNLLGDHLKLNESSLQHWIQDYVNSLWLGFQNDTSEYLD